MLSHRTLRAGAGWWRRKRQRARGHSRARADGGRQRHRVHRAHGVDQRLTRSSEAEVSHRHYRRAGSCIKLPRPRARPNTFAARACWGCRRTRSPGHATRVGDQLRFRCRSSSEKPLGMVHIGVDVRFVDDIVLDMLLDVVVVLWSLFTLECCTQRLARGSRPRCAPGRGIRERGPRRLRGTAREPGGVRSRLPLPAHERRARARERRIRGAGA